MIHCMDATVSQCRLTFQGSAVSVSTSRLLQVADVKVSLMVEFVQEAGSSGKS